MTRIKRLALSAGAAVLVAAASAPMAASALRGPGVPSIPIGAVAGAAVPGLGVGAGAPAGNRPAGQEQGVGQRRAGGRDGDGRRGRGRCQYPPSRGPRIVLSLPSHSHPGLNITVSGSVRINGCAFVDYRVGVYQQGRDGTWRLVGTSPTDRQGGFSVGYRVQARPNSTVRLRALAASRLGDTAQSGEQTLAIGPRR